mgnify:CR=1 FL=1
MSEEKDTKRPSHLAYQVSDRGEGDAYFNRIGAAWPHKDQQGYNIQLESTPVDGRITLRTPQERIDELRNEPEQSQTKPDQGHER